MAAESTKYRGIVSRFNETKGYGFIKPDPEDDVVVDDLFVHQSEINYSGYRTLHANEIVEFSVAFDEKNNKPKAVDVTVVGLAPKPTRNGAVSRGRGGRRNNGRGGLGHKGVEDAVCYKCMGVGHYKRDCPSLININAHRGGGGKCYECGEVGHYSRYCRRRGDGSGGRGGGGEHYKCFNCQEEGHFARECPNRKD